MFLTPKRDMKRKMSEVYISLLMEAEFTKEEIFSLYVNKIFLGQRAYGVAAAAEVYFGKTLDQLSIAEMATLAGIPTAPSHVNPVANPQAATIRRAHVLGPDARAPLHHARGIRDGEGDAHGEPAARAVDRSRCALRGGDGPQRNAGQIRRQHLHRRLPGVHHHRFAPRGRRRRSRCAPDLLEYDRRHGWRGATAKVDLSKIEGEAGLERRARGVSGGRAACGPPSSRRSKARAPRST